MRKTRNRTENLYYCIYKSVQWVCQYVDYFCPILRLLSVSYKTMLNRVVFNFGVCLSVPVSLKNRASFSNSFRRFTYVTAHFATLSLLHLRRRYFTHVAWGAAHGCYSSNVSLFSYIQDNCFIKIQCRVKGMQRLFASLYLHSCRNLKYKALVLLHNKLIILHLSLFVHCIWDFKVRPLIIVTSTLHGTSEQHINVHTC